MRQTDHVLLLTTTSRPFLPGKKSALADLEDTTHPADRKAGLLRFKPKLRRRSVPVSHRTPPGSSVGALHIFRASPLGPSTPPIKSDRGCSPFFHKEAVKILRAYRPLWAESDQVDAQDGKRSLAYTRPTFFFIPGNRTDVELALGFATEDEVLIVHYGAELGRELASNENIGTKLAGASEPSITSAPALDFVTVQTGGPA